MSTGNMCKNGEMWICFLDIRADRQTNRHTDRLIAILRTPYRALVTNIFRVSSKLAINVQFLFFFTARRYASAVCAVVVCPAGRLSVCLSVCPFVTSRRFTKTAKQDHTNNAIR